MAVDDSSCSGSGQRLKMEGREAGCGSEQELEVEEKCVGLVASGLSTLEAEATTAKSPKNL